MPSHPLLHAEMKSQIKSSDVYSERTLSCAFAVVVRQSLSLSTLPGAPHSAPTAAMQKALCTFCGAHSAHRPKWIIAEHFHGELEILINDYLFLLCFARHASGRFSQFLQRIRRNSSVERQCEWRAGPPKSREEEDLIASMSGTIINNLIQWVRSVAAPECKDFSDNAASSE